MTFLQKTFLLADEKKVNVCACRKKPDTSSSFSNQRAAAAYRGSLQQNMYCTRIFDCFGHTIPVHLCCDEHVRFNLIFWL